MKTRKTFEIEFERHNVTPAQFLAYLRSQQKKHGEMASDFDLDMFRRDGGWNSYYSNALPSERPCESEICKDKPYEKQTYIKWFNGAAYNEIIEFQFDTETTGYGYYYTVQIDVDEADSAENEAENVAAIAARREKMAQRAEAQADRAEAEAQRAEDGGYAHSIYIENMRAKAAHLHREVAETRQAIKDSTTTETTEDTTTAAQSGTETARTAQSEQDTTTENGGTEAAQRATQSEDSAETVTAYGEPDTETETVEAVKRRSTETTGKETIDFLFSVSSAFSASSVSSA